MLNNHVYKVKTVGTTDFTDSGASQNVAGQVFKAEKSLPGSGVVTDASVEPVILNDINVNFSGNSAAIEWFYKYKASVSLYFNDDNYNPDKDTTFNFGPNPNSPGTLTGYLPRSGSIKYTQDLKDQNQSDKPTWKGRALRKTVRAQIKRLKRPSSKN